MEGNNLNQLEEVIILKLNYEGQIIAANNYAKNRLELQDEELIGLNISDLLIASNKSKFTELLRKIEQQTNKKSIDLTFEIGQEQRIYAVCTLDQNYNTKEIELSAIDVKKYNLIPRHTNKYIKKLRSGLEETEAELQEYYNRLIVNEGFYNSYKMIDEEAPIILAKYNCLENKTIDIVSTQAVKELLGYEVPIQLEAEMIDNASWAKMAEYHNQAVELKSLEYGIECKYHHPLKGWVWIYFIVKYYPTNEENIINILAAVADINEDKVAEEKMLDTLYDPITQTPNQEYFVRYFKENRTNTMALIHFDIDNFKFVNDSFGRKYGDVILKEIANRLTSIKQNKFIVGHLIADEFIILLEDIESKEEVQDFMRLVTKAIEPTFSIQEANFGMTYSAGIATLHVQYRALQCCILSYYIKMATAVQNPLKS